MKALNLAGCGQEQQVYCFTQEGQGTVSIGIILFYFIVTNLLFFIELPAPEDVKIVTSNTTSIEISWKKFTLVELKALANYTVTYSAASASSRRQAATAINVPWTENHTIITNLNPGTRYVIAVTTSTSSRMSGTFTYLFAYLYQLALSPSFQCFTRKWECQVSKVT